MTAEELLINELAKEAGVTVRTIRYYMDQGLLPPAIPSGRYAHFSQEHLNRLSLILKLKDLHLPLEEVKRILDATPPEEIEQLLADQDEISEQSSDSTRIRQASDVVHSNFRLAPLPADLDSLEKESPGVAQEKLIQNLDPEEKAQKFVPVESDHEYALKDTGPSSSFEKSAPAPEPSRSVRESAPGKDALDYIARISSSQQRLKSPQSSELRRLDPSTSSPAASAPSRERWDRIQLAPGLELHVLEPADPDLRRMVEALIQEARRIYSKP